jgi:selenocysteine lyase/cysteine desulfurase
MVTLPDLRSRFPGLADGWVRLDGPAGTLPADTAIAAMHDYLCSPAPANTGGAFEASLRTAAMVDGVRAAVGRLLGAGGDQVIFGASSTALVFAYTRALARTWSGAERIVCTRLDHDSNVTPWVVAARETGAEVVMLPVDPADGSLDLADLEAALAGGDVTWVALSGASNLTGFAPDLRAAAGMTHAAGARLHVDAVARAPHLPIDVDGWGIDSLVTSPYKWYGPHAGILVLQPELLHGVEPPRWVAEALAERRIAVWSGDNYACELIDALGLRERGGAVRAGVVRHTTVDDVDGLLAAVGELA